VVLKGDGEGEGDDEDIGLFGCCHAWQQILMFDG